MVCVLKEKELKIYIQEKDYGKNGIKKKSNSKKSGEGHTCLGCKGNQKTLWLEKKNKQKLMRTRQINE